MMMIQSTEYLLFLPTQTIARDEMLRELARAAAKRDKLPLTARPVLYYLRTVIKEDDGARVVFVVFIDGSLRSPIPERGMSQPEFGDFLAKNLKVDVGGALTFSLSMTALSPDMSIVFVDLSPLDAEQAIDRMLSALSKAPNGSVVCLLGDHSGVLNNRLLPFFNASEAKDPTNVFASHFGLEPPF